ncbi:MAG: MerR family transcriptional regulator [Gammaproteobacteria bacterium]|nr:MerR family transcriptional regulator [Gammaproteobacteria bacterium]
MANFTTAQVARLTDLPAERLRAWVRGGLVAPGGGRPRGQLAWTFTDIVGLRVLAVLRRDYGMPARRLRRLLPQLCRAVGAPSSLAALAAHQLAVTGDTVVLVATADAYETFVDLLQAPAQQVLAIMPMEQVIWEVQLALAEAAPRLDDAVAELRAAGQWRVA